MKKQFLICIDTAERETEEGELQRETVHETLTFDSELERERGLAFMLNGFIENTKIVMDQPTRGSFIHVYWHNGDLWPVKYMFINNRLYAYEFDKWNASDEGIVASSGQFFIVPAE